MAWLNMEHRMRRLGLTLALGMAGCAATYTEQPLPPGHPANPDAPSAPASQRTRTLDVTGAAPPADSVTPPPAGAHAGHDHGQSHQAQNPATDPAQVPAATAYTCPMHPDVVSDQPGRCPRCGMSLVEKKEPRP